jgi:protein phosphatase
MDINGKAITAALVCDGMGGAKAGNVASSMAVDYFENILTDKLISFKDADEIIGDIVYDANKAIYEKSMSNDMYSGMGTTFVAAVVQDKNALIANIGDSRCYHISKEGIRQVTKDHSLVEDMVDRGEIDRSEAWQHPRKNYITRALGTERDIECDYFRIELAEGDVLILCSDGLSNKVSSQELLFEVLYGGSIESAAQRMLDIALLRGAPDNVTVIVMLNQIERD